jgi:hypothetical protein
MKNYKKVAAIAITALAITGSATALANASSSKGKSSRGSDHAEMHSAMHKDGNKVGMGMRGPKGQHGAMEAVITSTLGIDATTLRSRLQAGETLAAIAGAKKDALVAALIAEHTKRIDEALAAGKLTAERAKTLKDGLAAHINEEINEVHKPGMGKKGDRKGHGPGHNQKMGKPNGSGSNN